MSFVSRGFRGRRREDVDPARVPPGQHVTSDFPVLSAGPTPITPLEQWDFSIVGEVDEPRRWTWDEFRALPREEITRDIHCVTKWSKLDTVWEGVSLDTLLDGIETSAEYTVEFCDGGYTTNLPLEDVTGGKAWVALVYDGQPLDRQLDPRPHWCRGDRVAALGLVAVLSRQANVDVLACAMSRPAGDVEDDRLDARRLLDDVDDLRDLPAQSPQYHCSFHGSP